MPLLLRWKLQTAAFPYAQAHPEPDFRYDLRWNPQNSPEGTSHKHVYREKTVLRMSELMSPDDEALAEYFQKFLTPERRSRFAEVLKWRTRWLRVVLVDLYQQHNASAVLRTCDAMGIQRVNVVESYNEFEANPDVALGSQQWLTLQHHAGPDSLAECVTSLRSQGIRIAATVLGAKSRPIQELPIDEPIALMFGNEKDGLPAEAIAAADYLVHVPMYGFVESYNVSVATALCLQSLTERIHRSDIPWQISHEDQVSLWLEWSRLTLGHVDAIERQFHLDRKKSLKMNEVP